MKYSDLKIDLKGSFGSHYLLVDVNPVFAYTNGKVTDQVTGYRYTVVLPEKCYERLDVRVEGTVAAFQKPINSPFEVAFEDLQVSFYGRVEGTRPVVNFSCKAKSISAVRNK